MPNSADTEAVTRNVAVHITIDSEGKPSFAFDPDTIQIDPTLTKIVWTLFDADGVSPPPAGVKLYFPFLVVNPPFPADLFTEPATNSPDDTQVFLFDQNVATVDAGTYSYTLFVEVDGTVYGSDPQIINKSPTGPYR